MLDSAPQPRELRRHPRVSQTEDLHAAIRPPGGAGAFVAVHDLGAGGMGVAEFPPLDPAETVRFELWGSDFAWSGTARVRHVAPEAAGLEFVSWDGPVHRPLQRLVAQRR
jgi:hypothetical protein